ncbi:MAG: hypothetical protein KKI08_02605 [Armatimonadetes bacterium]|nr:hypothetical protein [Armatimonadota bacterium]
MSRRNQLPYSREELFGQGKQRTYRGAHLNEIAFPLGGIGTGSVSLGGWGQLRDWEIRNRPAKGRTLPQAFFSVRVQAPGEAPRVKVLQGPKGGSLNKGGHSAGHDAAEGLPHFREVSFRGEFPFAGARLCDKDFPVGAELTAFSPFIPLNDTDSSLPLAVLSYKITNRSKQPLQVSVMGNLTNDIGEEAGRTNKAKRAGGLQGLVVANAGEGEDDPQRGSLVLATPAEGSWVWPAWHDGRCLKFWEAVAWEDQWPPVCKGASASGTVGVDLELAPGDAVTVPFLLAWHFPNYPHWNRTDDDGRPVTWQNWYATQWADAWAVAAYGAKHLDRLAGDTLQFHDALFASTLPTVALDAISSQLSILRTNTCLRLTDGTFYGFEGCSDGCGCCEGSCTHVWNYAQALPYLFPALQRSVREADWANSMQDDGFVCFRMPLPLGTKGGTAFHPAADGQMGTVMQVYREWLISGDDDWLRQIWPRCVKALEFAWKYWDADQDGVMEGMQHNTYDMEFYGPNTMMGSLYLGALTAAAKLAEHLGEDERAAEYRQLAARGAAFSDRELFNGEYYKQIVNPQAHEPWPDNLRQMAVNHGMDDKFTDWPRWQFGRGCLSDQLLGQWYAEMLGLGKLYNPGHLRKTLQSIFRYNWRPDLTDHFCSLRVYALNDEAGLLIGTWPHGERPGYAFWFTDEVWCGIEYQVASHLIYEGLVAEGLAIVKGVRDRHTGEQRNPWNEFECGHHYARSLASYALLTALSGFSYSAPEQRLGFAPRVSADDFRTFFSVGSGWGSYAQKVSGKKAKVSVAVAQGSLTLETLQTAIEGSGKVRAKLADEPVAVGAAITPEGLRLTFPGGVTVAAGQELRVTLGRHG